MTPFANSYLTVLGALVLVFASAQMPLQFVQKGFVGVLLTVLLTFALLFSLMMLQPGPLKWILFGVFTIAFGQMLHASVQDAAMRGVLDDVLLSTIGITLAVVILSLWDTSNRTLGWGSYLFAGLLGLLVARIAVLGASFFGVGGLKSVSNVLSLFGSGLFAAYLAYDTQTMRLRIQQTKKGQHDYVDYALGPFLDIVNLFVSLEDLTN
jgi:FtsH-binding integral membrane protein